MRAEASIGATTGFSIAEEDHHLGHLRYLRRFGWPFPIDAPNGTNGIFIYIYIYIWPKFMGNVGKYSSPMDPMGLCFFCFLF